MAHHNELGNTGEEIAVKYLEDNGYKILDINWSIGKFELDIVAKKDDWLIIIEVKTRSTDNFEHPLDAITLKKIKNLVNGAHEYIRIHNWEGETRFDVISILPHGNDFRIEHIEDAFLPPSM